MLVFQVQCLLVYRSHQDKSAPAFVSYRFNIKKSNRTCLWVNKNPDYTNVTMSINSLSIFCVLNVLYDYVMLLMRGMNIIAIRIFFRF